MFTASFEVPKMFTGVFNVQKENSKLKALKMFREKIAGLNVHGFIWAVGIPLTKEKDPTEVDPVIAIVKFLKMMAMAVMVMTVIT